WLLNQSEKLVAGNVLSRQYDASGFLQPYRMGVYERRRDGTRRFDDERLLCVQVSQRATNVGLGNGLHGDFHRLDSCLYHSMRLLQHEAIRNRWAARVIEAGVSGIVIGFAANQGDGTGMVQKILR